MILPRLHPAQLFRLARKNARRAWLNYGFFWFGAVLVGLVAVLFARWANQAQDWFVHVIAGRAWLALFIIPIRNHGRMKAVCHRMPKSLSFQIWYS